MYLIYYIIFINLFAYYRMYDDKQRAKTQQWRISEAHFFTLAAIGGGIGVWLGTKVPLFHKAAHRAFTIGVPLIMLVQSILLYLFLR